MAMVTVTELYVKDSEHNEVVILITNQLTISQVRMWI